MDNCRQYFSKGFRTGARSGMKRSPRTSTSLEVIVTLLLSHWLLESPGFSTFKEGGLPADVTATSCRLRIADFLK